MAISLILKKQKATTIYQSLWAIYLDTELRFVMQASTPNDQTEHTEDKHKPNNSNENLSPPWQPLTSTTIKTAITTLFLNHLAFRPPFLVAFPVVPFPSTQRRSIVVVVVIGTRDSACRGSPWMVAIGLVWRWLHGAVTCRCGMGGWRFVTTIIVWVPWRALNIVNGLSFWRSRWWWGITRDIGISFCVHHDNNSKWIWISPRCKI